MAHAKSNLLSFCSYLLHLVVASIILFTDSNNYETSSPSCYYVADAFTTTSSSLSSLKSFQRSIRSFNHYRGDNNSMRRRQEVGRGGGVEHYFFLIATKLYQTEDDNDSSTSTTTTTTTLLSSPEESSIASSDYLNKGKIFDEMLDDASSNSSSSSLGNAIQFLREHRSVISITSDRFIKIFNAIEKRAATANQEEDYENYSSTNNSTVSMFFPPISPSRREMVDMYNLLSSSSLSSTTSSTVGSSGNGDNDNDNDSLSLLLFGAASTNKNDKNMATAAAATTTTATTTATTIPAFGSRIVTPSLLEQITELSMSSLTPKPGSFNTLLVGGTILMLLEVIIAMITGIDLNFLVFATLVLALIDRIVINGTIFESIIKIFIPQIQDKIIKHEAGHFLCAYLLGCPVEGCILNAFDAIGDSRFSLGGISSVSAGTSFFDPILSNELTSSTSSSSSSSRSSNTATIKQSSIDRYSIIVMGGIAAEAINFGEADGGAGDEAALVTFLAQLNSNGRGSSSTGRTIWNEISIKNQARWGALQAVLLLKHYKPCYDALVDTLLSKEGGTLGNCIYAIEDAARKHNLKPLTEPLGYILDNGGDKDGIWTTTKPDDMIISSQDEKDQQQQDDIVIDDDETIKDRLKEYKQLLQDKIQDIDDKLKDV